MKLTRDFYERSTPVVAKELLGKYLCHRTEEGVTVGKIVETEAYTGADDAASHAHGGLYSDRTKILFGSGGFAYIYLIYGMYYCFNIVTNKADKPESVFIRALEPVDGIDIMKRRRNTEQLKNLCSGPGKLCMAMGIAKESYGIDLCGDKLYLTQGESIKDSEILATPRINIDYAGDAKDYLLRYVVKGNKYISKPVSALLRRKL